MSRLYENYNINFDEENNNSPNCQNGVNGTTTPVENENTGTLQRPAPVEHPKRRKGKDMSSHGTFSRLKATIHHRVHKERPVTPWSKLPLEQSIRLPLDQVHLIVGYGIIREQLR